MAEYERKIGTTLGTDVEKEVAGNFAGETAEVGIYMAMARQASTEGYGELGTQALIKYYEEEMEE